MNFTINPIVALVIIVIVAIVTYLLSKLTKSSGGAASAQWTPHYLKFVGENARRRLKLAFESVGVTARFVEAGYDPLGPMAISAWETSWGSSVAANKGNNLFGISYEDKSTGKWLPKSYSSVPACLTAFFELMTLWRYSDAVRQRADGKAFIRALHAGGYNSETSWRDGCLKVYDELKAA